MNKKEMYESPQTYIIALVNEGIIAFSGETEGNLGSIKVVEEEWL